MVFIYKTILIIKNINKQVRGKNGKGGGANNAEKSITTRSGIQINFNDDSGSLNIKDPGGNTINLDGQGNISITAPNSFKVTSGSSSLELNKDGNIELKSEGNSYSMTTDSTNLEAPNEVNIIATSNKIEGQNHITGGDTKIDGGNVFIN